MQSGTIGINSIRIYSPTKQAEDQDPQGKFIRQWVPELADIPDAYLMEPWTMLEMEQQMSGIRIGHDYSAPTERQRIFQKHASRRGPRNRLTSSRSSTKTSSY